eukprot:751919-Pyramimonas_sp.AAC.1
MVQEAAMYNDMTSLIQFLSSVRAARRRFRSHVARPPSLKNVACDADSRRGAGDVSSTPRATCAPCAPI